MSENLRGYFLTHTVCFSRHWPRLWDWRPNPRIVLSTWTLWPY